MAVELGVTWGRRGRVPEDHVALLLGTDQTGGVSSSEGGLMRNSGTEYANLISRGLELSIAKTRIVHVDDGFDFLGFSVLKRHLERR